MIGRGAYGRPWLLGQVMAALRGEGERPDPGIDEQYDIITTHYRAMIDNYGEMTGVNMARKHLGWYVKGLPGSAEFRNKVNQIPGSRDRSEEHTSELQSLMRISYAVFCMKK